MLGALVEDGGTAATLECSSHALVLERLAGCAFDVALFLNLSHEHLDFHRDMDEYFEAKARLFGLLKPEGKAVVNLGDTYGRRLASRLVAKRTIGFFLEGEEGIEADPPGGARGRGRRGGGDGRGRCRRRKPVSSRPSRARDARARQERGSRSRSSPHSPSKKKQATRSPTEA